MHIILSVALLFVGTALSAPTTDATPKLPCCPPRQWQADVFDLKANSGLDYVSRYAFDADMKMDITITILAATNTPVYWQYTDYNTMSVYSVLVSADNSSMKCEKTTSQHHFFESCYGNKMMNNPDVKYLADGVLGATAGGVPFNSWTMNQGSFNTTIMLSKDGCAPVLEGIKGKYNGNDVDSLLLFTQFKDSIDDKSMFTMPDSCKALMKPSN